MLRWLKWSATIALLAAIGLLLMRELRGIDWPGVRAALDSYSVASIAGALAFGIPGYLACASFDLFGRRATGHRLSRARTMLISYTGYSFSLNLGALVGGLAFRYRLYAPYGLPALTIGQIIGLSVLTNWSGYVLIAGAVLAYRPPVLPPGWAVDPLLLRGTGVLLLLILAGYIALCAVKGNTRLRWKRSELRLPTLRVAALQILVSTVSWSSIGAMIAWLLPGETGWLAVMPVLMVSALAGVWSHVPGGLGVTEAVFLALLGHSVPGDWLLAALIAFRAIYYLVPLTLAVLAYFYLEATARNFRGRPVA